MKGSRNKGNDMGFPLFYSIFFFKISKKLGLVGSNEGWSGNLNHTTLPSLADVTLSCDRAVHSAPLSILHNAQVGNRTLDWWMGTLPSLPLGYGAHDIW